jgi:hypothetical protein
VNATREGLKREWIDLSAPSHPMLVSGACVTGGDSFKRLVEQMKSEGLDQDDSDDKTFKYELVSSGGVKRLERGRSSTRSLCRVCAPSTQRQ